MKRIRTVEQLNKIHGAVFVSAWKKPCSVAFLISMQARILLRFIRMGMFEYRPGSKPAKPAKKSAK